MSVSAVDVRLREHVEREAVLRLHARFDLRVRSGLLSRKLVAREGGDAEPISFVFFVQSLKLMVVDVGQTSVGRHVDYDDHFALVFVFELDKLFVDVQGLELVNRLRRQRVALLRPDHSQAEQKGRQQTLHFG